MSVSRVTPYHLINNDNKHQFYDYNSSDDDDNNDDESNCIPAAAATTTSGDFTTDYASPCENKNDADSTYTKNKHIQQQQQQQQMIEMNPPPQPTASQSTSRLRNAFQRLRGTSVSKANHIAPAEIIKPTPSKSSLAEKIKNKLQQQFEYNNNKKLLIKSKEQQKLGGGNGRGMIRSTSFSNAWSKWGNNNNATAAKHIVRSSSVNLIHYQQQQQEQQQQAEAKKSHRYQKHNNNTSSKKKKVSFAKLVSVRETFSRIEYDRVSDPYAICNRLTPAIAQQIKEELNAYKLHEMQVHEYSRVHTHFFI